MYHGSFMTSNKSFHVDRGWIVGNKAEWRFSKRVFQENKARQIFRKMKISYLLYAQVRVRIRR